MYNTTLENNQLQALAPSIFATQPWDRMSDKYKFIPTIDVINAMRDNGFNPVRAQQSITRIPGKGNFAKHMVRFRHNDYMHASNVGEEIPEIMLVNSHDGSSAYNLMAAIFRLVCSNGLVVNTGDNVASLSVRHSGKDDLISNVIEGTFSIIEDMPRNFAQIETFKHIELSRDKQEVFANAALELKGENAVQVFNANDLLRGHRFADYGNRDNGSRDLWRTFNVVQENLIRGGARGRSASGRRQTSRAVKSVNEDIRINKALWTLTSEMAKLAA